jgi:hypothetical protein
MKSILSRTLVEKAYEEMGKGKSEMAFLTLCDAVNALNDCANPPAKAITIATIRAEVEARFMSTPINERSKPLHLEVEPIRMGGFEIWSK